MNYFEQVYEIVRQIPKGKVMTYGQVAKKIGTQDARRVGHALHSNKTPEEIPCHRVVFSDGSMAPGYAFGGPDIQRKKLEDEGVSFVADKADLDKCLWILQSYPE